jgi:hypothetical protein
MESDILDTTVGKGKRNTMARYKIECCYNCPDRYVGCHSSCETYKTQRAELDQTNAEKRKKYEVTQRLNSELADSCAKNQRRTNYRNRRRKS